jgi:FkbM family methyltransferase
LEKLKLQHRAKKYQYREDRGGIAYIKKTVNKTDTVFDIGAHKAGYLHFFREQLGDTGKIFAFEPQSKLYHYLQKLKQLFAWENVIIESLAVSDQPGTAMLCIPYNHGKNSSPCATLIESHMDFTFQSREQVRTTSIDDYCNLLDIRPDFLKVDVEGNEWSVFKGAADILNSCRPRILFECEARFIGEKNVYEVFQFLQSLGYKGYFIKGDNIQPIAQFTVSTHQNMHTGIYCNNFIFE